MRFLIVDDDPVCRKLVKTILAPYGDCDLAFDGSEAIDAVRLALEDGHPYELICLDIMMPGTDGHEALEAIRKLEARHGIAGSDGVKIIMTTALVDSKHCIRAFRQGCESYVTKPVQAERLLDQMHALLGEAVERPIPATIIARPAPVETPELSAPAGLDRAPRYLIVDDDGVCRALLKAYLSPYGQCAFAYDGQEAIDAVRLALEDGKPYDLICLDIMMPGVSGHEALSAIRRLEEEHGVCGADSAKVVMTTALRDSRHCVQSFREGCECYVTKPIDESDLLGKMLELGLLERAKAETT
ncbi:MAG: response regulator [Patescibacteria group bacterium]|nr:response regulator [Patescibacteria group bacterium]